MIRFELAFPTTDKIDKLMIDDETLSYITIPFDAQIILDIIKRYTNNIDGKITIVDGTGGAGGNTICFGNNFDRVISIEIDPKRTLYLINNVSVYNLKNVQIINGDCVDIIPHLYNIDIVFLDPPWGGHEYKHKKKLRISLSNIEIEQVIINFFDVTKMLCVPKVIVLKMPKNYDVKYFNETVNKHNNFHIYFHRLKRMIIIVVKLI
jgi:16S rRNA G966 N2-methylase RsmD